MKVSNTHVASTATLSEKLSEAKGGWMNIALMAGALSAGFVLGGLGSPLSLGLERWRNGRIEDAQKDVLAEEYKHQVAAQLGMDPNRVKAKDLEVAAQVNPMIHSAMAKVEEEKKNADRTALLAAGAGAVLPPFISGIGHVGAHMVAGAGAVAVGSLMEKDVLFVQDVMENIDAKQKAGEPITAADVFMLRIAQDELLQKQVTENNRKPFHKMTPAEQDAVMSASPVLMAEAQEDADAVNNGLTPAQELIAASPARNRQYWANRVGGGRQRFPSFTEAEKARAAERAMMGQQVSV